MKTGLCPPSYFEEISGVLLFFVRVQLTFMVIIIFASNFIAATAATLCRREAGCVKKISDRERLCKYIYTISMFGEIFL